MPEGGRLVIATSYVTEAPGRRRERHRTVGTAADGRHRSRNVGGRPPPCLRAVLHDQGARPRHRSRPLDLPRHRRTGRRAHRGAVGARRPARASGSTCRGRRHRIRTPAPRPRPPAAPRSCCWSRTRPTCATSWPRFFAGPVTSCTRPMAWRAPRSRCDALPALDLLLTDLVLPGGNGLEVARRVRARYPGVPVLFMSGYSESVFAGGESRRAPAAETVHVAHAARHARPALRRLSAPTATRRHSRARPSRPMFLPDGSHGRSGSRCAAADPRRAPAGLRLRTAVSGRLGRHDACTEVTASVSARVIGDALARHRLRHADRRPPRLHQSRHADAARRRERPARSGAGRARDSRERLGDARGRDDVPIAARARLRPGPRRLRAGIAPPRRWCRWRSSSSSTCSRSAPTSCSATSRRLLAAGVTVVAEKVETAEVFERARDGRLLALPGLLLLPPGDLLGPGAAGQSGDADAAGGGAQPAVGRRWAPSKTCSSTTPRSPTACCGRSTRRGSACAARSHSIREALLLLGLDQVRKWSSIWALAGLNRGPSELVTMTVIRARCCELLGQALDRSDHGAGLLPARPLLAARRAARSPDGAVVKRPAARAGDPRRPARREQPRPPRARRRHPLRAGTLGRRGGHRRLARSRRRHAARRLRRCARLGTQASRTRPPDAGRRLHGIFAAHVNFRAAAMP